MSKTFEDQVMKAKVLAEGMKANLKELAARGVNENALDSLITECIEAIKKSQEVDQLREEASQKLREANCVLSNIKDRYNAMRMIIKGHYPLEQWQKFGLTDKR